MFINLSPTIKKILLLGYIFGVFGISLYALIFFLMNKVYLIGSDTFAYISIADSILQYGEAMDITSVTSTPLKTPQNGIVIFHILFSLLGINGGTRLVILVLLNYVFYLSAVYPLYMSGRRVGLTNNLAMVVLIGIYLGSWHIYRLGLLPNNDGIFYSLSIWLTYLLVVILQDSQKGKILYGTLKKNYLIAILLILGPFLILFRLHVILIIGSAFITSILVREYRFTALIGGFTLIMLFIIVIVYSFVDISSIISTSRSAFSTIISPIMFNPKNIYKLWEQTMSPLLIGQKTFGALVLIFTVFPIAILVGIVSGVRKRESGIIFISISCALALWSSVFSPTMHRWIIYIFPFLYLIVLVQPTIRSVGYLFGFVGIMSSLFAFRDFNRVPESHLWLHIYENNISLPMDDPLLVTRRARHTYFFLNTRAYNVSDDSDGIQDGKITLPDELKWDLINDRGSIFVLGDRIYINSVHSQIRDMAIENGFEIQTESLTPDLNEFEGWALVELTINKDY